MWSRRSFLAVPAALGVAPALAQFKVDISGVGATQFPIAIAPLGGEAGRTQQVSAIVRADLERSGQFRFLDQSSFCHERTMSLKLAKCQLFPCNQLNALA